MRVTRLCILLLLLASAALGAMSPPTYQVEGRIYGKVTDEFGRPLADVEVILEYAPFGEVHKERWTELIKTTTSERGEYKFSAGGGSLQKLPTGSYRLTFKYRDSEQVSRTIAISDPEGAANVEEVNAQLSRSGYTDRATKYMRRDDSSRSSRIAGPPPESRATSSPLTTPEPSRGPASTPTPKARPSRRKTPKSTPPANANASANTDAPANKNASDNTNTSATSEPTSFEIDRILQSLPMGKITFNTPESMSLNEAKKVELLLSASLSEEALRKAIEKQNVEGSIQVEEIYISDQMEATLTGDGFQITEVLPAHRAISSTGATEWTWDVRALREGKLRLHLTLNALVTVGGNPAQRHTMRAFEKEYIVVVGVTDTVVDFAKKHWQWLWTTILLPVGGWYWKRRRKNSEESA